MELKEFVKNALVELDEAIEEARKEAQRDIKFRSHKESNQTVEFDVAVTVENNTEAHGKAGIKVFPFVEGGGEASKELKNSSVSRVKFGVDVGELTKEELSQVNFEQKQRMQRGRQSKGAVA